MTPCRESMKTEDMLLTYLPYFFDNEKVRQGKEVHHFRKLGNNSKGVGVSMSGGIDHCRNS